MDARGPQKRPTGNRLPPVATPRGNPGPIGPLVKSRLQDDPVWGYFALNGKWICPFCLSVVNRRAGRSREDSISMHLESCRGFGNGHGQVQPVEVIARRQQYENLVHLADSDPSWRVYDTSGTWYCPACLDRVANVRIQGGQLTSFVYQAMSDHLSRCGAYLRGVRPRPEDVQRARDRAARFPALLQTLQHNLQFPAWRYVDAHGLWVCPCCLTHVPRVRVANDNDWQRAPEQIAHHLLQECAAYANDPNQVQPENLVREAAAKVAPMVQPTPVNRTPLPGSDPTPGHRTPQPSGQVPLARPATPVASPLVNGNATPPARPSLPPRPMAPTFKPTSIPGTPIVNRRVDSTPTGGSRITPGAPIAMPVTPKVPPPVVQPPATDKDKPTKDDTLFGKLPDGFLESTPLGSIDESAVAGDVEADEGGEHFGWMDDAESHEPAAASLPAAERTDMIKARAVQAGLMQKPPEVAGFKFAACFEACTDISGDFYQYIRLPDGRVGFAMGDVSGHGVQAGLIMSMAKKTFEIYASMGLSPADTLSRVNDAIARDLGGKLFISMVYALLDPTERKITWARAGHTPSLRYNPDDDKIEEIKPPGMVVGMKTGPMFRNSLQEQVTTVRSGDVLLLYTDGITETMNLQQEEFDTERLIDVMRRFSKEGADVLVNRIMEILRHFRGPQPPADDSTLMVITVD
jgi:serine phosphatase RsbU (regulator of sigma subunit)